MEKKAALTLLAQELPKAINANRSNPEARPMVREAILRLRQVRGMLELFK